MLGWNLHSPHLNVEQILIARNYFNYWYEPGNYLGFEKLIATAHLLSFLRDKNGVLTSISVQKSF